MIIRDDRPLTDRERAFIEALFRLSFKEVADRVQQGASPQEAVVGVVTDILSRQVLTLSPNLYKRWCASLLNFAEQQATGVKGAHSLVPVFHTPVVLGNDRNTDKDTRIKYEERTSGMSVIGGSGTGKTTLLIQVALADITNGHAVFFIDVDGDSINELLPRIPIHRMRDVILLDLSDTKRYIGLNPLAGIKTSTDADRYMQVFKRLWHIGPETPNLENTLRASLLTLSYCGLTVAEMPLLLRDEAFRKQCITHIPSSLSDDWLRWYWEEDYEKLYKQLRTEPASSTLNKVLQLLTMKQVAYAVSQSNTLNLRKLIDERKIILLRLSLQDLGEDAVRVLGTFLMAELKNALFSRIDVDVSQRNFVSLIADEAQLYVNADFYEILTRGRKYGIGPSLATQTLTRLDPELRGILDQLNIHVSFRVGTDDASKLAHYYAPKPKKEYEKKEVKQEKKAPGTHPVNWLVSGGRSHSSEAVNAFVKQWEDIVKDANTSVREGQNDTYKTSVGGGRRARVTSSHYSTSWSNRAEITDAREGLAMINDLLYKVMLEKNPFQRVQVYFCVWVAIHFNLPFYKITDGTGYFSVLLPQELGGVGDAPLADLVTAFNQLWLVRDEQLDRAFATFHIHVLKAMKAKYALKLEAYFKTLYLQEFVDEPYEILKLNRAAKNNPGMVVEPIRNKPFFCYWSNEHAFVTLGKYPGVLHYKSGFEKWEEGFGLDKGIIPLEQLTYEIQEPNNNRLSDYFSPHIDV